MAILVELKLVEGDVDFTDGGHRPLGDEPTLLGGVGRYSRRRKEGEAESRAKSLFSSTAVLERRHLE